MKYLLKDGDGDWYEVSKRQWVMAERLGGFHNTMGRPNEPATSSWSCTKPGFVMAGKIENEPLDWPLNLGSSSYDRLGKA